MQIEDDDLKPPVIHSRPLVLFDSEVTGTKLPSQHQFILLSYLCALRVKDSFDWWTEPLSEMQRWNCSTVITIYFDFVFYQEKPKQSASVYLICLTCWTPVWTCQWYSQPTGSSAARKRHACPEPPHVCRTGIGSGHRTSASHLSLEGTGLRPVNIRNPNPKFSMMTEGFEGTDT